MRRKGRKLLKRIVTPLQIMIEGPLGGAAFNNEFGRPNLNGYFRTFETTIDSPRGPETRGYHKPIMIAGGMGNIRATHVEKSDIPVGAKLIGDLRVSGVCFTGGTTTARIINKTLADRDGPITPLIAETGGFNSMFVDTTALREQVIDDVIDSAFGSAGQRCSALRIVFLPNETADHLIEGLIGAMDELNIGDPGQPNTDLGPVIDAGSRVSLQAYVQMMKDEATVLHQLSPGRICETGDGFGPALIELSSIDQITEEKFGPILHVLRYDPDYFP